MLELREIRRLLLLHPNGLKVSEIAILTRSDYLTVWRYLRRLHIIELPDKRFTAALAPGEIEYATAVLWRADADRQEAERRRAADDGARYERDDA